MNLVYDRIFRKLNPPLFFDQKNNTILSILRVMSRGVALPEASIVVVSITESDKCTVASTFCYVAPELSFSISLL